MSPALMHEALIGRRRALQPEVSDALLSAGISVDTTPLLGIDDVMVDTGIYERAKRGSSAIILPAFRRTSDGPELYDLIAIGLHSHRSATRRGAVQMLGEEWIEAAFIHDR